jgi:membrane protease YdiL (CAAX protease family)
MPTPFRMRWLPNSGLTNNSKFDISFMQPPFRSYPLFLRIILMCCMFLFNISIVTRIALEAAPHLFGVSDIVTIMSGGFETDVELYAFLFVLGVSSLGGFALTAMMFSVLEAGEFSQHLRLSKFPSAKMLLLGLVSIFAAQFFIEFMIKLNEQIPLPASLQFLEELQKQNEIVTNKMLDFTSIQRFVLISLVVAVIPAVGEEFFFRGLLLGDLLKGKVNPAVAIVTSGFLFSVIHGQFNNLIAIWMLGSFLGYLYYVSGSLWLPIVAHFVNNFLVVVLKYLFNTGAISADVAEASVPLWVVLISVVIFSACIFIFHRSKKEPDFAEAETINEQDTA